MCVCALLSAETCLLHPVLCELWGGAGCGLTRVGAAQVSKRLGVPRNFMFIQVSQLAPRAPCAGRPVDVCGCAASAPTRTSPTTWPTLAASASSPTDH
eukprot:553897-Rhodomonas_salina.1